MAENKQIADNHFKFFHNAETRLYVENAKEKDGSIFSNVYSAFFNELNEKLIDIKTEGKFSRNNLNNIFAFVGERGSGKTSCMLSVAKMLEENIDNAVVDKNTSFQVLDSTDPSFFDDKTNILDIILGHLFGDFKTRWEKSNQNNINEKNELLESFEKVKQTISCMNMQRNAKNNYISAEDNVDKLLELSASVSLAKDIQDLVQKYLKFCKKDVLVVPIDDIDLHSRCAYEMVEQVRKYLVQEKVIILMALKIEQLDKVVEKAYLNEFDDLIKKDMLQTDQIAEMANKYLVKLLPDNQRFVLPSIEIMYNKIVDIYYEQNDSKNNDTIDFLNKKWEKDDSYSGFPARYIIVKLIFSKTRYLFYHMQGASSLIVPHTLREYNQLLELLFSMPNYKECDSKKGQYNKDLFKQYFVQSWCRSNLEEKDAAFIRQLFAITDVSIINKTIVQTLRSRFEDFFKEESKENKEKKENVRITSEKNRITDEKNKLYNISIGDVNYILRGIKDSLNKASDKAFVFAIETFYSMRLYAYYDLKTETSLERKKTDIEKKIRVKNETDNLSEYEIFVGGSFYNINTKKDRIIPENESGRRDCKIISLKTIRRYLDDLLPKEGLSDTEWNTFRLIELFTLLIQRRNYKLDRQYRTRNDVVYASEFVQNQNNVWFNILSFFSNLIDVKRCYNRIDERFFDKAKKNKESLYNHLLNYCADKRTHAKNSDDHPLMSYCSIRNMEILNDLFNHIQSNFRKLRFAGKNQDYLITFFNGISSYSINSYDEQKNTNKTPDWNQIDFEFVNVFVDTLKDAEENEFNDLFAESRDEDQDTDVSDDGQSVDVGESRKIEKNPGNTAQKDIDVINKIESWALNEDLHNAFEKRTYVPDEVRNVMRSVLRDTGAYCERLSRWIAINVRNSQGMLNYSQIDSVVNNFIDFIMRIKNEQK